MHICLFKIVCFLLAWFIFALLVVLLFRFAVLEFVGFRFGLRWVWFDCGGLGSLMVV